MFSKKRSYDDGSPKFPQLLHECPVAMSQTPAATIHLQDLSTYSAGSVLQDKNTSAQQLTDTRQHGQSDSSKTQASGEESSLPLVDRGKDAWLFLAACWVVEAITFGELLAPLAATFVAFGPTLY